MIITYCYIDTYSHCWTWLDSQTISSKDSLREGGRTSEGLDTLSPAVQRQATARQRSTPPRCEVCEMSEPG